MPYYVYAVKPFGQLQQQGEHAAFKDASAHAKALRTSLAPGDPARIKVMFADSALAAEDLLLQVRDPAHPGEE
jgi:hypothetical protein